MNANRCPLGDGAWWRQLHARQESTRRGQPASAGWALRRREIVAMWRGDAIGLATLTELFQYDALLPEGSSHEAKNKAQAGKE